MQSSYDSDRKGFGRVLILDEEANVRKLLKLNLMEEGFDVIEARTSEEAIQALKQSGTPAVHVIISDIRASKIHGIETIAYFRAQYPSIPVVLLTTYSDICLAVVLMRQGVVDYLVKPVRKDDLISVVRYALDQYAVVRNLG